jgi:hypothetical protein
MVGSVCEWIYYSPDCCLKQNQCAREHGYSPCFDMFTTSLELLLILLMQIKMVMRDCNLGHHLTDRQGATVARQGVVANCLGAVVDRQGVAIAC